MDTIAKASSEERAELFLLAATELKPERSPLIIEKDFWVCWVLHRLFEVIHFHPQLIFKGGTSLSKVYKAIDRFSEDVDLSLSRHDLGFIDDHDPEQMGISKKECKRRLDALAIACKESIHNHLIPKLKNDFSGILGSKGWKVQLDENDPQTVLFFYPISDADRTLESYIRPFIRLEMGARSDDWPASEHTITPYAADAFPQAFKKSPSCHVRTLEAERTFWEKATILHMEYHRPKGESAHERLARHYYDLYWLSQSELGEKALARFDLLHRVVEHKKVFFRSAWAHYETASPGSFHLVPPWERMTAMRADYAQMEQMIFGETLEWMAIVEGLEKLEKKINSETGQ